jgi:hypothetical protein
MTSAFNEPIPYNYEFLLCNCPLDIRDALLYIDQVLTSWDNKRIEKKVKKDNRSGNHTKDAMLHLK